MTDHAASEPSRREAAPPQDRDAPADHRPLDARRMPPAGEVREAPPPDVRPQWRIPTDPPAV
jgi:hypothetical protein